jgi:RNA polymerase sigma-70 factor (ECF subfamily)
MTISVRPAPPVATEEWMPETLVESEKGAREEVLRLFLQHQASLSGFLYAVAEDWEVVEEALQETAVFVCGRWQDFTPGTDFGAWARTVARLRCLEVLARRRRSAARPLESVAEPVTDAEWSAHGAFSARRKEALARCVKALPDPHRRIVELHYVERQPCERVAEALRKRVEAVYMTLSRIRKRLRSCVGRRLEGSAP